MIPLPSVSQIVELIKSGATLEAREEVMKLREGALERQEEMLSLAEQLRVAKAEIAELEAKLAERAKLRYVPPVYYAEGDEIPFCPLCYETGEQRTHLFLQDLFGGGVSGECKACGERFTIKASPGGAAAIETVPIRRSDRLAGL